MKQNGDYLAQCYSDDPVDVLTGERMGRGWSDTYDYRLYDQDDIDITSLPAGNQSCFLKKGSDLAPAEGSSWKLAATGAGYTLTAQDQCRYLFDEDGT